MGHQGSALLCAKAAGLIHRHGIRDTQVECRSWSTRPDRIEGSAGELFDAVAASTMLTKKPLASLRLSYCKYAIRCGLRRLLRTCGQQ
jgi:hypothetical protein